MAFLVFGLKQCLHRFFTSLPCCSTPSTSNTPLLPLTLYPLQPLITQPPNITLHFHIAPHTHTRHIPFSTFAPWPHIYALLQDLQNDGLGSATLYDRRDETQIGSGDWDARVREGMEVDVFFEGEKEGDGEDEGGSESDDGEDEEEQFEDTEEEGSRDAEGCDKEKRKEWCFTRWRQTVERDTRDEAKEQGRKQVLLGALSVLCWLGVVVVCLL